MRTKDGKYSPEKIQNHYAILKSKLNDDELAHLVHSMIQDKHLLIKTVELINDLAWLPTMKETI